MNKMFNPITPVRAWCYKVLPQVYDDSLSYYELLCKIKNAVNELIATNNELPDYIRQIILDYLSTGEIGKIVADMLAEFILNVKFPPTGLKPASGDGTEDDTEAIQGCIDYAFNNGGMAVYFPNGVYLTNSLTLKDGVSLVGAGRYNTRLVLKGGATQPLIIGNTINNEISNISLDGNADIQVNNLNLIELNGSNYLFENLILNDGYELLHLLTIAGHTQLNNIVFKKATIKHLFINGLATVQANNIDFESLSALNAETCIDNKTDNAVYTNINCLAVSPLALINTGNNCLFEMSVKNAVSDYIDSGLDNIIRINGKNIKETLTGNKQLNAVNNTETLSGDKTVNAKNSVETLTEDKSVNAVNNTETLSGDKTINAKNSVETLTEDKNVNAVNNTETLSGDKTINAKNSVETLTEDKSVNAVNIVETVTNDKQVNAKNSTEVLLENKDITANNIILNSHEPLTYKKPLELNRQFNYIPFKDSDNSVYKVLVEGSNIGDGTVINVKDYGAIGDGVSNDTVAIQTALNALNENQVLYFPNGIYVVEDLILDKSNVILEFIGKLKYVGSNTCLTVINMLVKINNLHIYREVSHDGTGRADEKLLYTGLQLSDRNIILYAPRIEGFRNALTFHDIDGRGVGYIDIYSCHLGNNLIAVKCLHQNSNSWTNETHFFGGRIAINDLYFANIDNSAYFDLLGDCHRVYGLSMEGKPTRKIKGKFNNCLWNGCRFEGTNGNLDIEIDGNSNRLIDNRDFENKYTEKGYFNIIRNSHSEMTNLVSGNKVLYLKPTAENYIFNIGYTSAVYFVDCSEHFAYFNIALGDTSIYGDYLIIKTDPTDNYISFANTFNSGDVYFPRISKQYEVFSFKNLVDNFQITSENVYNSPLTDTRNTTYSKGQKRKTNNYLYEYEICIEEGTTGTFTGITGTGTMGTNKLTLNNNPPYLHKQSYITVDNNNYYVVDYDKDLKQLTLQTFLITNVSNADVQPKNPVFKKINPIRYEYLTPPTTGTWEIGFIVYKQNPITTDYIGWVCTSVSPLTWKPFGKID